MIVDPNILPYIRMLINTVSSLVNDEQCRDLGQHMIEVARLKIKGDADIHSTFERCINTCIDFTLPAVGKVCNEFTMFHARVNEYMTAAVEIDLEQKGKAVKADQSL